MKSFFISSTFRDMQEERDIIHRIVFPALRNTLKKYGETAEEVDLRWGVDTLNLSEEDSGRMVIKVCVDAIDRCVPYFIVLLSERYGWIPDSKLFENLQDERLEQFQKDISITEMEIQYGALSHEIDLGQCIFCFRNDSFIEQIPPHLRGDYISESPLHKEKLELLKSKIRSIKGANILDYEVSWDEQAQKVCGLESFAQQLQQMLIKLFENEGLCEEQLCEEEKITRNANFVMQQHLSTYVNREKIEQMLPISYASGKNIWFSGESGCGKSAFLSFAANQCRQKDMVSCVYYGGNPGCQNTGTFLRWLCYELEKICDKKLKDDNHTKRLAIKKIQSLSKHLTKPVMVFIDAADQMSEDILWTIVQLLNTTSKIQFFVTSTQRLCDTDIKEAEDLFTSRWIDRLTDTEVEMIVSKVALRRGKSLDAKVTKKIRQRQEMHLPINLSLLLQRLFMMDGEEFALAEKLDKGMEGISRYMQNLIDSTGETSEELTKAVVNKTVQIMQDQGEGDVIKLLGFLAAAPDGISLRTLSELCPQTTMLHIQQLFFFLYDMVEESEDGRFRYNHPLYLQCIRSIITDDVLKNYETQLFEKFKESGEFQWNEYIRLGITLKREELADEIANALINGTLTDEQIWNESYFVKLAQKTKNETFIRCILRGIYSGAIDWSEESFSLLNAQNENSFVEKETLFYLYGAQSYMHYMLSDFKEEECCEKQYQMYAQIQKPSLDLLFDAVKLCEDSCRSSQVQNAQIWYQRLSEIVKNAYLYTDESDNYILLHSIQVWYKELLDYKTSKNEQHLEQLGKYFDANKMIYSVQDNLNLYEQKNPGHNERCMNQLTKFAHTIAGIYLKSEVYSKAYPYAKIAYAESKKAYQLNRTMKTAEQYSWATINLMRCMKKGTDIQSKYADEALNALNWMESMYPTPKSGEWKRFLCTLNVQDDNSVEMREKALQLSRNLRDKYPENGYDEWVLFDYRKLKDALKSNNEHVSFHEIFATLCEIEKISKNLYQKTNDGYFLDLLHEWALDMVQAYTWQGKFSEAERYLLAAQEYLQCDYIQKGRFRWHREQFTAVNALVLYYLKGDKKQTELYMQKAEELYADEEEKNKNKTRVQTAILWSGRIEYMRTKMLWEETHDIEKTFSMLDTYFSQYKGIVDEDELRPARLLLAQLHILEGNTEKAIAELNKCCMKGNKLMPWQMELQLSEYSVWQFLIAAQASLFIYDLEPENNQTYLNKGIRALSSIIDYHTLDKNASNRKVAGNLLAQYFMRYQKHASKPVQINAADVLLRWMTFESENRALSKEEKELTGECLTYQTDFDANELTQENERACEWLMVQQKMYPDDIRWNDRVNRFLVKKALWYCVNNEYEKALKLCENIKDGECESFTREKNILTNVCKVQNGSKVNCIETLKAFCAEIDDKKSMDNNDLWVYMEALIALSYCYPDNADFYLRKTARILEERILDKKRGTKPLWKRDYVLRNKCLEYSQLNTDVAVQLDDMKAARMAWANFSGNDKESNVKLLEWDGKIARTYEGVDERLEWVRWETVISLLNALLVKKDLLDVNELTQVVAFYQMLLQKMHSASSWRYYTVAYLIELAIETTQRLYNLTKDAMWLSKTLEALDTYRMQIADPKFDDDRNDFKTDKIAQSYLYDMDVYQIYLDNNMESEILEQLVSTGKVWLSYIFEHSKHYLTSFVGIFKQIDEHLEGKSLEIKSLISMALMHQKGDSNEIFWIMKKIFEKYGTELTNEEMKKYVEEEMNNNT